MKYGSPAYNALLQLTHSTMPSERAAIISALIAADIECKRLEEEVKKLKDYVRDILEVEK